MISNISSEYFSDKICDLFLNLIIQDELNVKVLFFIVEREKNKVPTTIKDISNNVAAKRRVAVKKSGKVVSYTKEVGLIDRKTSEKIIERLVYASLIYLDVLRPYKYIKLTTRGAQVAIQIKKRQMGGIKQ